MKYLFFDTECANCFSGKAKICEFGYIMTDNQFSVIDRNIFIINPNASFDWYVIKNMLAYDKKLYLSSPDYTKYFAQIRELLEDENTLVIGHTTNSDIKYLNDESRRYTLPFINCKFYDAKFMYSFFAKTTKQFGVTAICDKMGIQLSGHEHKSTDDAMATMRIVKELCNKMDCSVQELIADCEDCIGYTEEGIIKTVVGEKARIKREKLETLAGNTKAENMLRGNNKTKFLQFLDVVGPRDTITQNELTGKTISISLNYEYGHFHEMLSIVQLLANCGCSYCLKASSVEYFVTFEVGNDVENQMPCSRLKYVNEAIANGAKIKIITFEELLQILNTTEEALQQMPFPDEECFCKERKPKIAKESAGKVVSVGAASSTTLGDIFKAQGIDIKAIINDE